MKRCDRCTSVPGAPPESGSLCLAPPLTHTLGTLRDLFRGTGTPFEEPGEGVLAVALAPGRLVMLAEALLESLSQAELADTRSVVLGEGTSLSFADLARMQPLATLLSRVRGSWLPELIAGDRLVTHFQPIVEAARPDRVYAFECLTRGVEADGTLITPTKLYQTARSADLLFQLDRAARLMAIRSAQRLGITDRLFINFNPTSIYDPAFCLRSTTAAIAEAGIAPGRVVFEVVESDKVNDMGHLRRIIEHYRQAGFGVALDDLGAGFGSLNLLTELRPDTIKLDMELTRGVDADPYKARVVSTLLAMARGLGITSVAEGVETVGEWEWLRDHEADYVQGYLFARPGTPPPRPKVPTVSTVAVAV